MTRKSSPPITRTWTTWNGQDYQEAISERHKNGVFGVTVNVSLDWLHGRHYDVLFLTSLLTYMYVPDHSGSIDTYGLFSPEVLTYYIGPYYRGFSLGGNQSIRLMMVIRWFIYIVEHTSSIERMNKQRMNKQPWQHLKSYKFQHKYIYV